MAEGLKRGDLVIVSAPGEYGKPRPAVVVQADFRRPIESYVVCSVTSDLVRYGPVRPTIYPSDHNGLRLTSQVMTDKIMAVHIKRIGRRIGNISTADMEAIDRALAIVLGLQNRSRA